MYAFDIDGSDTAALWRDIASAADALTGGEPDPIANMANVAALLWQYLPQLNWAGFYRLRGGELVLGPFQGKPACIRIPLGQGVCGAAAADRRTLCIADVHAFPGHIACDAASAAELVVPVIAGGAVIGVIDLDSPVRDRFGPGDVEGCERLAAIIADRITEPAWM